MTGRTKEATVTKIGGTNAISFAYKECFEMKLKDRPEVGQKIKFIEPD